MSDWEKLGTSVHQEPCALASILQTWYQCRDAIQKIGNLLVCPPDQGTLPSAPLLLPAYDVKVPTSPKDLPLSSVQVMLQEAKTDPKAAEILPPLAAFPVIRTPGQPPCHECLPFQVYKELNENANEDCKTILKPVYFKAKTTLANIIQSCQNVGTESHKAQLLTAALRPPDKTEKMCFGCGRTDHFHQECRPAPAQKQIRDLPGATAKSAGIDLEIQDSVELQFPREVQILNSPMNGPLPPDIVELGLPRSHPSAKGIIDPDYTGNIKMQVWVNFPQILCKGQSIAQLVLLPCQFPPPGDKQRNNQGFGSTLHPLVAACTTSTSSARLCRP